MPDQMRAMLRCTLNDGLIGVRDRALLLLGFGAGMRRSELVALDAPDVRTLELPAEDDGAPCSVLEVTIRRSKTDQEGRGRVVVVHAGASELTCPVRAVAAWIAAAQIAEGPLFRSFRGGVLSPRRLDDEAVALIAKRTAKRAGIKPEQLGGHSLRAGFVTTAASEGTPLDTIAQVTGHHSLEQVMEYIRTPIRARKNPLGSAL